MFRKKEVLASLVLDSIQVYETMNKHIHPVRKRQIKQLKDLCCSLEYDQPLKLAILLMIKEIETYCIGWFYVSESKLSLLLDEALLSYEMRISQLEANERDLKKPTLVLPSSSKLIYESEALMNSQLAVTNT